jgi:hypothetical protein
MVADNGKISGQFVVNKFEHRKDYELGKPYEVSQFPNVLLNEGKTRLLNLLVGGGGTAYSSGASALGVGNSTASSGVATSTGLLTTAAAGRAYVGIADTYPTVAGSVVTWRSVFSSNQANFNWREFTVTNSASTVYATAQAAENLNRAVSNQGTKVAGQVWTLDLQITVT